jgi:hypothetical protein
MPLPGVAVAVIWRNASAPGSARGRLRTLSGDGAAVDIDGDLPWKPGAEVLLVAGEVGSRLVAKARFHASRGNAAIFTLAGGFHPFDLRGQARYPLLARTEVRSVLGQSRQPGQVLDISLGGLAVEVATKPGGKMVEVPLQLYGYAATLLCEIVGTAGEEGHIVLHLQFATLTPPQRAFVRNVVQRLQREINLSRAS